MSRDFELPAEVLGRRVRRLKEEIDSINRQINPMIARRDNFAMDLRILENAIEVLRERDPEPWVEASPGDGEAPAERQHKYAIGDKVVYTGDGPHKGLPGVVEVQQPISGLAPVSIWYEVKFPDSRGLITIPESNLRAYGKGVEDEDPLHQPLSLRHPVIKNLTLTEGHTYVLMNVDHPWHRLNVRLRKILKGGAAVTVSRGEEERYVKPEDLTL